jgi:hypothetical protein
MISFYMLSLSTTVPIRETSSLLSGHIEEDIMRLFRHVLNAACFTWAVKFYTQLLRRGYRFTPISGIAISSFVVGGVGELPGFSQRLCLFIRWTTHSSSGHTDPTGRRTSLTT